MTPNVTTSNVSSTNVTIRIQEADFDVAQEIAALSKGRKDIGAVVSFSGICRDSEGGEAIAALTLEHYPGMAEAEIARHAVRSRPRPCQDNAPASARRGSCRRRCLGKCR